MTQEMDLPIKDKGFTLIELMIVIAVIGVLASIAIPMFAAYRQRSYNTAALSDLKNFKVAEEALLNEQQVYGYSTSGGPGGLIGLVTGPGNMNTMVSNGVTGFPFSLSNNVSIYGVMGAAGAAFNVSAKHFSGGKIFGADSDVPGIFTLDSLPGTPLVPGDTPAAATPGHEFAGWNEL